jgi:hypothetical protein
VQAKARATDKSEREALPDKQTRRGDASKGSICLTVFYGTENLPSVAFDFHKRLKISWPATASFRMTLSHGVSKESIFV